jgi:translation initiation factor 2B subunit (eIF-2B alpha/beta/delta family)
MTNPSDDAIDRLRADRLRGASALAKDAVEILAAAPAADRQALAERLAALRPSMPAIAAIAREAARLRDPRDLLIEIEAEHEWVAKDAAALVGGAASVATISNSSLVERVLGRVRPDRIVVAVDGATDEGHQLVARLRVAGLDALAVPMGALDADLAVVSCDAIFEDGGFVNRSGSADLVARFAGRPVIVVGDRWRRVAGPTPALWSEPELFESVSAARNVCVVDGRGQTRGRPDRPESLCQG